VCLPEKQQILYNLSFDLITPQTHNSSHSRRAC